MVSKNTLKDIHAVMKKYVPDYATRVLLINDLCQVKGNTSFTQTMCALIMCNIEDNVKDLLHSAIEEK